MIHDNWALNKIYDNKRLFGTKCDPEYILTDSVVNLKSKINKSHVGDLKFKGSIG